LYQADIRLCANGSGETADPDDDAFDHEGEHSS
jgi:hypothetical protein